MKTKRFFIATLLVVVATTIAMVSCKKENQGTLLNNSQSVKAFTPPVVDDMNAYLKDFKQKMQNVTRDGNETLSLEEAAWHLSSVANYDFGNVNVEYDNVRFDTLHNAVNITDGVILMSDLAVTYENISTDIDEFYHSLVLENKHFKFIDVTISEQGEVKVCLITTFSEMNRWHYFPDSTFCDQFFSDYVYYYANGNAVTELRRLFNLNLATDLEVHERNYYIQYRTKVFYFKHWLEDINNYCPNSLHYRLFCTDGYFYDCIPKEDMCYYLDSYCGLAADNAQLEESVIFGNVEMIYGVMPEYEPDNHDRTRDCQTGHHLLTVTYGCVMGTQQNEY